LKRLQEKVLKEAFRNRRQIIDALFVKTQRNEALHIELMGKIHGTHLCM
jgi:hypothetical protein